MFDVITIGSATVDAFVDTKDRLFHGRECVRVDFGSKILIDDVRFDTGGGGTNTAVAFARLGLKTGYLGKVGYGVNSKRILNALKKEKVDTRFVKQGKGRTGFSVILDAKGHDRTILVFKGSNDDLDVKDVDFGRLKTKWFYFATMMNKSFETQQKIAEYAEKNNINIMYNPSQYMCKKGLKHINPILKRAAVLVLNKEEARLLVKGRDSAQLALNLYAKGPGIVLVTDGKKGCCCYDGECLYLVKSHNITALEATGAGDSFGAGFLSGFIKRNNVEFGLKLAQTEAESVITHPGAKNKLLRWGEALNLMKKKPVRIVKK